MCNFDQQKCAFSIGIDSKHAAAAEAVPETFELAKSGVSRRVIRASARELRRLQERRLDDAEWLVLVLDGKTFAGDQMVIALGVTATGEKRILGLVQTASENKRVIARFLRELGERSFPLDQPLLAVLDGAKGLRAEVRDVFGNIAVNRCQWHKRENVLSYLAKQDQGKWRRKIEGAYAYPTYGDTKRALERLMRELRVVNESAAASLAEGLEEMLTLHRLNVFVERGVNFRTTNLIESVMAQLEANTQRVTRGRPVIRSCAGAPPRCGRRNVSSVARRTTGICACSNGRPWTTLHVRNPPRRKPHHHGII